MTPAIQQLITSFATNLTILVQQEAVAQARDRVVAALGGGVRLSNGRAPHAPPLPVPAKKARKKGPIQLCPVPGCRSPAAPVFAMVCAKHKGLPKATIKKFREARRAKAKKAA